MIKKNLLLIVPNLTLGGQQRVAINTAAILGAEYNITIAVFTLKGAVYHSDCQTIDLDIPAVDGFFHKSCNVFKRIKSLKKLKRALKIDVSYSFGSTANLANALSRESEKIILSVHGYGSFSSSFFKKNLDKYVYRRAQSIICVAEKMRKDLIAHYLLPKDKVVTVYNPYDFDTIASKAQADISYEIKHPAVITMGRLEKVKGYRHLLRVFSIVQQSQPDAALIFLGDGDMRIELEMMAADLDIADQVVFLGFQANPFSYIAKSDVFVLSSIHEGFPNALVESMACGIPAVASDCKSGPREILSEAHNDSAATEAEYADYGILIPPYSADDSNEPEVDELFANTILCLLNNKQTYMHYREKARERARSFSFDAYKHKIKKIIEQ